MKTFTRFASGLASGFALSAALVGSEAFAASASDPDSIAFALSLLAFLLASYFLPTIIAALRRHPNVVAIGLLNLLLGWTFVGWIAALVWSVISLTTRERVIYVDRERD